MTKIKYIIELIIFLVTIVVSILFNISNIVGSGSFLTLFLGSLSLFYLIAGWVFFRNEEDKIKSLIVAIPSAIISSFLAIAIFFKMVFFPDETGLLIVALVSLALLLIFLLIKYLSVDMGNTKKYYLLMIGRMFISVLVTIFFIYFDFSG